MSPRSRAVLVIGCALLPVRLLSAQSEPVEWRIENVAGLKAAEVRQFLGDLQTHTARRDSKAACAMIQYPLRMAPDPVKDEAACRTRYERIFTRAIVEAIAAQRFADLFANYQGVMIGKGEVWLSNACKDQQCQVSTLKIVAINH